MTLWFVRLIGSFSCQCVLATDVHTTCLGAIRHRRVLSLKDTPHSCVRLCVNDTRKSRPARGLLSHLGWLHRLSAPSQRSTKLVKRKLCYASRPWPRPRSYAHMSFVPRSGVRTAAGKCPVISMACCSYCHFSVAYVSY